jgi:hypothetical protein
MSIFYKGTNDFAPPSQAKLPAKYCAPVKTPLKDIAFGAPPYQYDVSGKQPASLVMLKAMHNSTLSSALDGTQGVVPGESFTQQKILKDLKASIDKFCE